MWVEFVVVVVHFILTMFWVYSVTLLQFSGVTDSNGISHTPGKPGSKMRRLKSMLKQVRRSIGYDLCGLQLRGFGF